MRWMLRSKIHQATVTDADLRYVGSITIDEELMDMVGLLPGEKVMVVSNTSGARLETYTIPGPRGSGVICMNGAAAHLVKKGEEIIIMGFELADRPVAPKQIVLGPCNEFVRWLGRFAAAKSCPECTFDGRLQSVLFCFYTGKEGDPKYMKSDSHCCISSEVAEA